MMPRSRQRPARPARTLRRRAALAAAAVLGIAPFACSDDPNIPPLRSLDRPSAIEFGCHGDLRIVSEEGEARAADPVVSSAQPLSSCQLRAEGSVPPGQEDLEGEPALSQPTIYGFALQRLRGSVAVIDAAEDRVRDGDPLTPGTNAIPIGTLPVDIDTDASGCYLAAANAGSCDLSFLDIDTAIDLDRLPEVTRRAVVAASGERVRARPAAIAAQPQTEVIGAECPDAPDGIFYVAYPRCNLVAAVEAATGDVVGGVRFDEEGGVEITGGDVSCEAECNAGAVSPDSGSAAAELWSTLEVGGPPRPAALHMSDDGDELLVAADNSPRLLRVTLDEGGIPESADEIVLEGDVGVLELAVSPVIDMGGDSGEIGGVGHLARFLYAVASDRTIRVVDLTRDIECDTQVDHRMLYDERDVSFLSCMPVGDPDTPARRAGARSPGIHLPRGQVPLGVAFSTLDEPVEPPAEPAKMVGRFAFITSTSGFTHVVNVDDDHYQDFKSEDDPGQTYLQLALPHTLRDLASAREAVPETCDEPAGDPLRFAPRLVGDLAMGFRSDRLAADQTHMLPKLKNVPCGAEAGDAPVSELSILADTATRELAFPDLYRARNDRWFLRWEGALPSGGRDAPGSVFAGSLAVDGDEVEVRDGAARFCGMGAEPYDIVDIRGCDPADRGVCGLGEDCFVHPDQPPELRRGLCLPADRIDQLRDACAEVLTSQRRYSIRETHADRLVIDERRRVLGASPLQGCESDAQCTQLARHELRIAGGGHPIEGGEPGEDDEGVDEEELAFDWVCAPDPSRDPDGPDRCQVACDTSGDCEPGTVCSERGFCVEGALPPAECASGIERFEVRVGDAYAVVGDQEGFLHGRVADPDTGECVADPDAHPLDTGRIPLQVPLCESDEIDALTPNPCETTVDHEEFHRDYQVEGEVCVAGDLEQRTREAPAIRFRNPAFTFHLVDYKTRGDAQCIGDREGDLPEHAAAFALPELAFQLAGGFVPMFALTDDHVTFAHRIVRGPLGRMWVLDEGEISDRVRGRIVIFEPGAAAEGFGAIAIE